MKFDSGKEAYGLAEITRKTGLSRSFLQDLIFEGKIRSGASGVIAEDAERLLFETVTYMGLAEFSIKNSTERFNGNMAYGRETLLDYIEKHNWWGIEHFFYSELLIGKQRDYLYFYRNKEKILYEHVKEFLEEYGLNERQITEQLILKTGGRDVTKKYLHQYQESFLLSGQSYVEFVRNVIKMPDVLSMDNSDVQRLLEGFKTKGAKRIAIQFLNYVKEHESTGYGELKLEWGEFLTESNKNSAYGRETYINLALLIFGNESIKNNNLIEKALDNHVYVEAWLFFALYFVCGARAGDICNMWKYLELYRRERKEILGINKETLREDILMDRISENTYRNVCRYCVGKINIYGKVPTKNVSRKPGPIPIYIGEELEAFFGMLTLICEYNMIKCGRGYVNSDNSKKYRDNVMLNRFFGADYIKVLGGRTINIARLNKSFLQGIELTGIEEGLPPVLAAGIASYARSHTSNETIKAYVKDHSYTGEDAETVLYYMMDRGILSFEAYHALLIAYPDTFTKLSIRQQNKLMDLMKLTALEIEQLGSLTNIEDDLQQGLKEHSINDPVVILKALFVISQNGAKGKECGTNCMLRACGMPCDHAEWKSCIANTCRFLVFTKYGIDSLMQVIFDYLERVEKGDQKSKTVLEHRIIPRFRDVIKRFEAEVVLTKDERVILRSYIQEGISEYAEAKRNR